MPVTRSAKKALRQTKRRHERNVVVAKVLKDAIKKYKKAPAADLLSLVFQKLDKAAKANVIKKNTASRLKSRLSKHLAAKR